MSELWDGLESDNEMNIIASRIIKKIQGATSKELSDPDFEKMILQLSDSDYTKNTLQIVEDISTKSEDDPEKVAVVKALILSTWLQRLYFIIRSFLMGQVATIIAFVIIFYLGTINVIHNLMIGAFIFVSGLVITRLFDAQINETTKKIVRFLSRHKRLRDFVMDHF